MSARLDGRIALVTGGGRGIGRSIAIALAEQGADIAINYRRDRDSAANVADSIRALGQRAEIYQAAVDQADQAAALIEAVIGDFGTIGILVNNAGIASRGQAVADTDPAELDRVMRVHAIAPHNLSRLVIPYMRDQQRGDIIMISSIATCHFKENGAPYTMAKAAMEALARTLAKEERRHGIRTNIVAPGLTVTDMGSRLATTTMGVSDIHDLDARFPFGRVGTPADVAAVVAFLVSPANSYANGQRISVDGGG